MGTSWKKKTSTHNIIFVLLFSSTIKVSLFLSPLLILAAVTCSEAKKPGKFGGARAGERRDKQIERKTKASKNESPPVTSQPTSGPTSTPAVCPCASNWSTEIPNYPLTSCCLGTGGGQANDQSAVVTGFSTGITVIFSAQDTGGGLGTCGTDISAFPAQSFSVNVVASEVQACYDFLGSACGTVTC